MKPYVSMLVAGLAVSACAPVVVVHRPPPPAYRCAARIPTGAGPEHVICPLPAVQPLHSRCFCPPPPNYPDAPPLAGHAVR